jgi:hypothetical protein
MSRLDVIGQDQFDLIDHFTSVSTSLMASAWPSWHAPSRGWLLRLHGIIPLAGPLPLIGSSISRCPAAAFVFFWRSGCFFVLAEALLESGHQVDHVGAGSGLGDGGDTLAIALAVDEFCQRGLVSVFEFVRIKLGSASI